MDNLEILKFICIECGGKIDQLVWVDNDGCAVSACRDIVCDDTRRDYPFRVWGTGADKDPVFFCAYCDEHYHDVTTVAWRTEKSEVPPGLPESWIGPGFDYLREKQIIEEEKKRIEEEKEKLKNNLDQLVIDIKRLL